jgi:hypothetical protein
LDELYTYLDYAVKGVRLMALLEDSCSWTEN